MPVRVGGVCEREIRYADVGRRKGEGVAVIDCGGKGEI